MTLQSITIDAVAMALSGAYPLTTGNPCSKRELSRRSSDWPGQRLRDQSFERSCGRWGDDILHVTVQLTAELGFF